MKKKFLNVVLVLAAGLCAQSFFSQALVEAAKSASVADNSLCCVASPSKGSSNEKGISRMPETHCVTMGESFAKRLSPDSPYAQKEAVENEKNYNKFEIGNTSNKPDFAMYVSDEAPYICKGGNNKNDMYACLVFSPTNIIEKYGLPEYYMFEDCYLKLTNSKGEVRKWPAELISVPLNEGADLVMATDFVEDKSFFEGSRGLTVELVGPKGTIASFKIRPKKVKSFDWFRKRKHDDGDVYHAAWIDARTIIRDFDWDDPEFNRQFKLSQKAMVNLIKSVKHPSQYPRDYYLKICGPMMSVMGDKMFSLMTALKQTVNEEYESNENFRKEFDAINSGDHDFGGVVAFYDAADNLMFDFNVKNIELKEFKKCGDVASCANLIKELGIEAHTDLDLTKAASVKMKNKLDKQFKVIISD